MKFYTSSNSHVSSMGFILLLRLTFIFKEVAAAFLVVIVTTTTTTKIFYFLYYVGQLLYVCGRWIQFYESCCFTCLFLNTFNCYSIVTFSRDYHSLDLDGGELKFWQLRVNLNNNVCISSSSYTSKSAYYVISFVKAFT